MAWKLESEVDRAYTTFIYQPLTSVLPQIPLSGSWHFVTLCVSRAQGSSGCFHPLLHAASSSARQWKADNNYKSTKPSVHLRFQVPEPAWCQTFPLTHLLPDRHPAGARLWQVSAGGKEDKGEMSTVWLLLREAQSERGPGNTAPCCWPAGQQAPQFR